MCYRLIKVEIKLVILPQVDRLTGMRTLLILVTILLTFLAPVQADQTLDSLSTSFAASMYLDRLQTEVIVRTDNNFHENNYYLKRHHTIRELNTYFGGLTVAAIATSYLLPLKYGKGLMFVMNCIQFSHTAHNYQVGVRVAFKYK